jgi:PAS domain S-box-containing protein
MYGVIIMEEYFKSIIEQDRCAVVICNLEHEIIYMNPVAAQYYGKKGGASLVGKSIIDCHNQDSQDKMKRVVDWFAASPENNIVYTFHNEAQNKDVYMVALRSEGRLIGYYEKHEFRNSETMKMYDLN